MRTFGHSSTRLDIGKGGGRVSVISNMAYNLRANLIELESDVNKMAITSHHTSKQMTEAELAQLRKLAQAIKEYEAGELAPAISLDDVQIEVPPAMLEMIRELAEVLLEGDMAVVVPIHQELTTQEAADFLNVSRPYLVKILEEGAIPFHMVGTHRRLKLDDVLTFKEQLYKTRRDALAEMARISQEAGMYDRSSAETRESW